MASGLTLIKNILNVKGAEVTAFSERFDKNNNHIIDIQIKPLEHRCPVCGARCSVYDHGSNTPRTWRDMDWRESSVFLHYTPARVKCPEHGVIVEDMPWAYHKSRFTEFFDNHVACLATQASRSFVAAVHGIDWETVARCIDRMLKYGMSFDKSAYDNLTHIGTDETSFLKGYKFITTVNDLVTGRVIWAHEGHSYDVLKLFFQELTDEQKASIKSISGDGAQWIDKCAKEFIPHAKRCVDSFHVICWFDQVLDRCRLDASRKLAREGNIEDARKVKGSKYALGKAPEKLTENQKERMEQIRKLCPSLHRHHLLRQALSAIVTSRDPAQAELALDKWIYRAKHFCDKETKELADKIKRHKHNIMNTIETGFTSAQVEGMNNKIKLIIRTAYGFRNVKNLIAHILFCCGHRVFDFVYKKNVRPAA